MTTLRKTVFIIDDNEDMVEALSTFLQTKYVRIVSASNPHLAVRLAKQYFVDVLLLDLKMPGLNGLEVLRLVRQKQPDVKVIVYTGYAKEFRKELEEAHVDFLLEKPAEAEQLLLTLERCIGPIQMLREITSDPKRIPKAKLLIVDDETEVCTLLKEGIEEAKAGDFEIEVAFDGQEALDKAMVFEPDLVLVDIKMPYMWGDELILKMQALPIRKPKAYIILTAVCDEDTQARLTARGHLYLTKPFKFDELLAHLTAKCHDFGLVKEPG